MNIEIDDALVARLREAEKKCDAAFGSLVKERAEQVLGEVVDAIVKEVVAAIQKMSVKEQS